MKAWEVIGWSYNGALYHAECKPEGPGDPPHPIFASDEIDPLDYCDTCLCKFIMENPGKAPARDGGTWVYLDTERAETMIAETE